MSATGGQEYDAGFVAELCADNALEPTTAAVVAELVSNSPLSMWAAKTAVARLRRAQLPDGDDIVRRVFGSEDFHRAVAAFSAKEPMHWTGS